MLSGLGRAHIGNTLDDTGVGTPVDTNGPSLLQRLGVGLNAAGGGAPVATGLGTAPGTPTLVQRLGMGLDAAGGGSAPQSQQPAAPTMVPLGGNSWIKRLGVGLNAAGGQ